MKKEHFCHFQKSFMFEFFSHIKWNDENFMWFSNSITDLYFSLSLSLSPVCVFKSFTFPFYNLYINFLLLFWFSKLFFVLFSLFFTVSFSLRYFPAFCFFFVFIPLSLRASNHESITNKAEKTCEREKTTNACICVAMEMKWNATARWVEKKKKCQR